MEDEFGLKSYRIGLRQTSLYERCFKILKNTLQSRQDMKDRESFLREHPEARRRINTHKLKQIIDYQDFKCHPQCSIARGEAVAGSDIDGGLVVLKDEVPTEQQLAFVEELRKQGFSAFHPSEVQAREQQLDEARVRGLESRSEEFGELIRKSAEAENAKIKFYTTAQLEEMKNQPLDHPTIIYVAGYSIE